MEWMELWLSNCIAVCSYMHILDGFFCSAKTKLMKNVTFITSQMICELSIGLYFMAL